MSGVPGGAGKGVFRGLRCGGLLAGLFGCLLLVLIAGLLGALVMLAVSIGIVAVAVLKLVYLYRTAQVFRGYSAFDSMEGKE